jgi:hypothetical protein
MHGPACGHWVSAGRAALSRRLDLKSIVRFHSGSNLPIYLEHFWNDFAADPSHSVPEADRRLYARAYAQPGAITAGFEYFRNFERDAEDFARLAEKRLPMALSDEQAGSAFLMEHAQLVASNVRG